MHFAWYDIFWWFDMPMHFLGGFFVLLMNVFITERYFAASKRFHNISIPKQLCLFIFSVLVVGILWELFELFFVNYIGGLPFGMKDTISDLCFDVAGAFAACIYMIRQLSFFTQEVK